MSHGQGLTHPGQILAENCLTPLQLSVADAARALGVSRKALSALLNGRQGISPAMALRIAAAFGESAEQWLQLQDDYDLSITRRQST